jgi:hypothetical protein
MAVAAAFFEQVGMQDRPAELGKDADEHEHHGNEELSAAEHP